MSRYEKRNLATLFKKLINAPKKRFPAKRQPIDAPNKKGVYIIYGKRGRILHVGRTPKAKGGLAQRLCNHMANASSFTRKYLDGKGAELRDGYLFQYLYVRSPRTRALLEAHAIGQLCPAHIGLSEPADE